MKNLKDLKIIKILQLLSKEEFNNLEKWLNSNWCNTNQSLIHLYYTLHPFFPSFDFKDTTIEDIFLTAFPTKPYAPQQARNMLLQFRKQIENYLVHSRLKSSHRMKTILLCHEYEERHDNRSFTNNFKLLIDTYHQEEPNEWLDDLHLSLMYEKSYRQPASYTRQINTQDTLTKADDHFDKFYILGKARLLIEMVERDRMKLDKAVEAKQITEIKEKLALQKTPVFKIYYSLFATTNDLPKHRFEVIWNQFEADRNLLEMKDRTIILMLLINMGIRIYKVEGSKILTTVLDLYELGLRENILLNNGRLSPVTFANIITIANSIEKYDMARHFIKIGPALLGSKLENDARIWAKGHIEYFGEKKQINEIELTRNHRNIDNTTFSFRIRVLSIQLWFDDLIRNNKHIPDFLNDQCKAFEKVLTREKKFSATHLESFKAFSQATRRLIKLYSKKSKTSRDYELIRIMITEKKKLHAKRWLLHKIEYLEKGS